MFVVLGKLQNQVEFSLANQNEKEVVIAQAMSLIL